MIIIFSLAAAFGLQILCTAQLSEIFSENCGEVTPKYCSFVSTYWMKILCDNSPSWKFYQQSQMTMFRFFSKEKSCAVYAVYVLKCNIMNNLEGSRMNLFPFYCFLWLNLIQIVSQHESSACYVYSCIIMYT